MIDPSRPDRLTTAVELLSLLEEKGILARTVHHPPVRTVEEAQEHWRELDGVPCKNLLFRDAKKRYWMVVAEADRDLDLKKLPERIGSARLSFASADRLREVLGIEPGAVSPLALINDPDHRIRLVVHRPLLEEEALLLHPLENTATTAISGRDLLSFLGDCGHEPQTVDLDAPCP
jgi:Ala-tRNA(Pro) deacylase